MAQRVREKKGISIQMDYDSLYTSFADVDMCKFDLLHFLHLLGINSAQAIYLFDEEII